MAPSGTDADAPGRGGAADLEATGIQPYRMSLRERIFGSRQPPLEQIAYARQEREARPVMELLRSRDPQVIGAVIECLGDLEGSLTALDVRVLTYYRTKIQPGYVDRLDAVIESAKARLDPTYVPKRPSPVAAAPLEGSPSPTWSVGLDLCKAYRDGHCVVGGRDSGPCDGNPRLWKYCSVVIENQKFGSW